MVQTNFVLHSASNAEHVENKNFYTDQKSLGHRFLQVLHSVKAKR